ncbi:hypothetical protein [Pseudomonas sp. BMS12]|uniref:hypothetical protein n=1 Tax=Pseudomonas sp. BMS12 TaxID=1796033 RepID=UPI00083AFEBB|nr:hypothetical protein [Pseudomonas sp. BMS12]
MKRLLLLLLLPPLHTSAAEKAPSGEPLPAMALVERSGVWQLQPTQLQSYVDELGALADIRGSLADARLNLIDARLRPGAVPSVLELGAQSTCYNDAHEPKAFVQTLLQAGDYRLECKGDALGNYSLRLSVGKRSQMLPGADPASGSWQLLWAGDLDRDGKPDLVSEYSVEGGYCQQVLLSATAGAEQLLAPGEPHCLAD